MVARVLFALPLAAAVVTAQAPMFTLPAPTGPFPIGTTQWQMTADLSAVAWYPAATPLRGSPAPYLREGLIEAQNFSRLFNRGSASGFDALAAVVTHAAADAPLAATPARLPLLVFSHGYIGIPSSYTALLEDLASHGFAVVSIVHRPDSTVGMLDAAGTMRAPIRAVLGEWAKEDETMAAVTRASDPAEQMRLLRGYLDTLPNTTRVVEHWVADTRLALERLPPALAARLDTTRLGAVGHSIGGVAAAQFCLEDSRCAAAANLDGIPQYGSLIDKPMGKPFLMVYSARAGRAGASDPIYRRAATPYVRADVRETLHLDFSDMVFWAPLRERKALGAIAPERAMLATRRLVREFFDQTLRGRPSPLLTREESLPEVTVRTVS